MLFINFHLHSTIDNVSDRRKLNTVHVQNNVPLNQNLTLAYCTIEIKIFSAYTIHLSDFIRKTKKLSHLTNLTTASTVNVLFLILQHKQKTLP